MRITHSAAGSNPPRRAGLTKFEDPFAPVCRLLGGNTGRKYTLTLGVNASNVLNHANYAAPSGDLSSPYFGVYRSLGGGFGPMGGSATYNRKIDVQVRLGF